MTAVRSACLGLTAALCLTMTSAAVLAQQAMTSATLAGTVLDPSEAVVPGASVSLKNQETNWTVAIATDERGRFRIPSVPVGKYELAVAASGFATTTVNLVLSVGQAIDVPVRLVAARLGEEVNVSAAPPLVDAARTQVGDVVTQAQIGTLPLNGRNYLDLALLVPNVSRTNTRSNERFAETSAVPGTGISVAGQRNLGNTFVVDGLSANDDAADLAGTYFSEEVIREFRVVTTGGNAEFGRAAAGIVNIVTQSGTNRRHGRAYGFFRDDSMDAKNALATREDPFNQRQYGLTYGGPIARDRTFWFTNFERTEQQRTGFMTIADASVRAINQSLDAFGYPGPRIATGDFGTGYDTTNAFARIDHTLGGGSRLELRYGLYDVRSPNARGVGGLNAVSRGTRLDDRDQTAAASLVSAISPRLLNEVRAQYTRSGLEAPVNDLIGPSVSVSGVANFGTSTSSPVGRDLDTVEVANTLTLQQGAHLLKAGVAALYNRVTIVFPGALQGTYSFTNLANLQRGTYQTFQQAFGIASLTQSNPNLGLFVQEEWRPRAHLTLHAGLRYDLQQLPDPVRLDANNVAPRLGIAWSPNATTVVRASGGLYFDRIPLRATSNAIQRDGVQYKVAVLSFGQAGAPVFPNVLPEFPSSLVTAITTIDPRIQSGRTEQAGIELEHALGRRVALTAGYTRIRANNIIMSRNLNVPTLTAAQAAAIGDTNLGRPDPDYSNISQFQSIGDSWFDGLTVGLAANDAPWGSARVSYTLSRTTDTSGNAFFSTPQDNFDIAAEKGPSDNDQRHRVMLSGTVGGSGASSRLSRALAGVQLAYVAAYATGVPFNVLAGSDLNFDTNNNDRPSGVGRNSARQPSTATVDLRVSRLFRIGTQRLEAILEGFNLFNRTNILALNNTYGTGLLPAPTFGQPTLAGDPRQIQLGLRWSF